MSLPPVTLLAIAKIRMDGDTQQRCETDQPEGEGDSLDQREHDQLGARPGVGEHVIAHHRPRLRELADDAGDGVDHRSRDQRDRGLLRETHLQLLERRGGLLRRYAPPPAATSAPSMIFSLSTIPTQKPARSYSPSV